MVKQTQLAELARIAAVLKVERFDVVAMHDFSRLVKSMNKADRIALGETLADMLAEAKGGASFASTAAKDTK
jgi:hypothetical protein